MRIVITWESDDGRIEERDAVTVTDAEGETFRRLLDGQGPANWLASAAYRALKALVYGG